METNINNEEVVKEQGDEANARQTEGVDNPNPAARNKIHSSAMYAASKWHSSVRHARPQHNGDSLLPLQA